MKPTTNRLTARRRFLQTTAGLSMVAILPSCSCATGPAAKILETKVISQQLEFYHGWPTVVRRSNGDLWLSWSGGRESHVCPFGQVHAMTSYDDGGTWSWPRVLFDSATDDRDSGVLETAKGTLLVTTFTSLAYESHLEQRRIFSDWSPTGWGTKEREWGREGERIERLKGRRGERVTWPTAS